MPDVELRISTDSAEAVAKLRQFAAEADKAFKGVTSQIDAMTTATRKAKTPLDKLLDTPLKAASDQATTGLRDLAEKGFGSLTNSALPGFSSAVNLATRSLSVFGLGVGSVIAGGALLLKSLKDQGNAWDALSERMRDSRRDLDALQQDTASDERIAKLTGEIDQLRGEPGAMAAGGIRTRQVAIAEEAASKAMAAAERERDKRIETAETANREIKTSALTLATDLLGITNKRAAADVELNERRAAAEEAFSIRSRKINSDRALALAKIEDDLFQKRRDLGNQWLETEAARMRAADSMERALDRARTGAALGADTTAAEISGDPVAKVRAQFAERTDALRQSLQDQLQAEADKLERGEILDTEYRARARALADVNAQHMAALRQKFVSDETAALATIDQATLALFEKLGPGFEDLTQKLTLSQAVEGARSSFQTIAAAFDQGRVSAGDAAEAVRRVTEGLTTQGAKIDDIAKVVPTQLQNVTSLFRSMGMQVDVASDETEGINTAMRALDRGPVVVLTDDWYKAAEAAEQYRLKVLEIVRLGTFTPRVGQTVLPGATAFTPQAGQTVADTEGRRALAAAIDDDRRRGLYE
jgi:hypothetical protein